jgi:hypothetical protein
MARPKHVACIKRLINFVIFEGSTYVNFEMITVVNWIVELCKVTLIYDVKITATHPGT